MPPAEMEARTVATRCFPEHVSLERWPAATMDAMREKLALVAAGL